MNYRIERSGGSFSVYVYAGETFSYHKHYICHAPTLQDAKIAALKFAREWEGISDCMQGTIADLQAEEDEVPY